MKPRLTRLRPPKNGLLVGTARGLQVKIKMTSDFQDFQLWRIPNLNLGTTDDPKLPYIKFLKITKLRLARLGTQKKYGLVAAARGLQLCLHKL